MVDIEAVKNEKKNGAHICTTYSAPMCRAHNFSKLRTFRAQKRVEVRHINRSECQRKETGKYFLTVERSGQNVKRAFSIFLKFDK